MVIKLVKNFFENRRREKLRQQLMHGKLLIQYYDADWVESEKSGFYQTQMNNKEWKDLFAVLAKFCNSRALILDVGCGPYELMAISNNENTIGTDVSRIALRTLKQFGFKGETILADALRLPFINQIFDCLVSNQMIEHLLTTEQIHVFIKQTEKLAYEIMIVTPNCAYSRQINDPTHFHFFTTRSLKRLAPGFRIYGCSSPPAQTLRYYFQYDSPRLAKMPVVGKLLSSFLCKIDDSRLMKAVNSKLWPCSNIVAIKAASASAPIS